MNTQATFAQALLNPELPCPGGLVTGHGADPARRFAVYRNNVMVSLIDALADTYPVLQALLGEEFFRAMARVFAQAKPPRSPVMAYYGGDFAEFVATFAPAASVPYLADVARLEMARVLAYHAADVAPVQRSAVEAVLADPEQLLSLRLGLHPSLQVVASDYSVFSIWAAHQHDRCMAVLDPDLAQTVLVYRNQLEVDTREISPALAAFVRALQSGQTLLHAAGVASHLDPEFDLSHALALLLRCQLITQLTTERPA